MATTERATKNLKDELERFSTFTKHLLTPVLIDLQLSTTEYKKPLNITATQISDQYGFSISKAFALMFKRLAKHKIEADGKRNGSLWLPYPKALFHFQKWVETTEEETGRSLLKYLEAAGVQEMTWHPALKAWITPDLRRQIKECSDNIDLNDGVDYSKLLKSLAMKEAEHAKS